MQAERNASTHLHGQRRALAAAMLSLLAPPIWSQTVPGRTEAAILEEVVVTARKREETLTSAPVAVSVVSGATLQERGITNLEQVSAMVPTLQVGRAGQTSLIFIRGIGSGINRGFEQSAGFFVDGVYMPRSRQFTATMLDVDRIEVLRGPQGLLFGKNTIAGAIKIETASPSLEEAFGLSAGVDWEPEHDMLRESAALSGALSDRLAVRIAGLHEESDGYVNNVARNADEPSRTSEGVRLTAVWEPVDALRVSGKVGYVEMRDRGKNIVIPTFDPSLGVGLPITTRLGVIAAPIADPRFRPADGDAADFYTSFIANPGFAATDHERTESLSSSLKIDWGAGAWTVTSLTGYSDFEFSQQHDVDFLPINLIENHDREDMQLFSEELRIASSFDGALNVVGGLYYEDQHLDGHNNPLVDGTIGGLASVLAGTPTLFAAVIAGTPVSFDRGGFLSAIDQDAKTYSVFAEVAWEFAPTFFADLGGRFSRDEKHVHRFTYLHFDDRDVPVVDSFGQPTGVADPLTSALLTGVMQSLGTTPGDVFFDQKSDHFEPSARLRWRPSDTALVYLTYGEGYKGGGVNASGSSEFAPEETESWELGARSDFLGRRGRAALTLYETTVKNLQTTSFQNTVFIVGNAGEVKSRGVEAEVQFLATPDLEVGASVAYLDNEYVSFVGAACTIAQLAAAAGAGQPVCTQNLSGRRGAFAPEWSGAAYARYAATLTDALDLQFDVDVSFKSNQYLDFDLDPNKFQDSYTKLNARIALGWRGDASEWELAVYGRNLTDEETYTFGVNVPLGAGAYAQWIEEPRTVGIQARVKY